MTRSVEQIQEQMRGVSDEELTRLIDTVKVRPPPPPVVRLKPARMGMPQGPATRGQVSRVMVKKLREKWGRMR